MNCPNCSKILSQVKAGVLVLDYCPACRGIWFDKGEFTEFVNRLSLHQDVNAEKIKLFCHRKVNPIHKFKEENRICPRCSQLLKKFNYAYDSNVFLDKCTICGGIWADKGEAKQIAGYLKDDPNITAVGQAIAELVPELPDPEEELEKAVRPFLFFFPKLIIPISDDTPRERFPVVTVSLILLCLIVFLEEIFLFSDHADFVKTYGFVPAHFFSFGLITSMFVHGNIIHFAGNMFFLWLFGDNVEDRFSRLGFLGFYFCSDLFANILHTIFNLHSQIPSIGASGAISGVMGAYLVFYPSAEVKTLCFFRIFCVPAYIYLGGWFLLQLWSGGMSVIADTAENIGWFAHIGGFVFGMITACIKKRTFKDI